MLYSEGKRVDVFNGDVHRWKTLPHQKSNPRPFNLVTMHHSHTFLTGLGTLLACTVRPKVVASTLGDLAAAAIATVSVTSNLGKSYPT